MLLMRGYEPHCPSRTCTGGHKNKLFHIKGKPNWLPLEVWIKKRRRKLYTDVVTLGRYGSKKNQRDRVLMQGHLVIMMGSVILGSLFF